MADLASLMQYAPTVGAGFMGINQRQNEQTTALKQMELEQLMQQRSAEEARKAAMNPFELERARLGNQGLQADLETKGLTNQKTRGTIDSDIDASNFKNNQEMQMKIMQELGVIGAELEGVSDAERPLRFAQALEARRFPKADALLKRFSHVPPSELPKVLAAMSEKALRATPAYAQTMDQEGLQQAGANQRNAATIAGQRSVEQMRIDAGKYKDKKAVEGAAAQLDVMVRKALQKGARAGHSAAIAAAEMAARANLTELAAKYTAVAEQIRPQAEAEIARLQAPAGEVDLPGLSGGSIPVNPNRSIAPPGAGPRPAQAPANDVGTAAKAAWGSYDPNKYDYRVGPNGKLQRKEK